MKLTKFLAGLLSLLIAAPFALAAEPRAYIGAGAGFGSYDGEDTLTVGGNTVTGELDDSSFGGVLYGGYEFNENLAFELAYFQGTEVEGNLGAVNFEATFSGLNPGMLIKHKTDQMTVFGHVGMMFWDYEVTTTNVVPMNVSAESDGNDITFGVGVEREMSDNSSLRADWRIVDADGISTNIFWVSFQRYF